MAVAAFAPIWFPVVLLGFPLVVVSGLFITFGEEVVRPGWHASKLRRRDRRMPWEEWWKQAAQSRGTTILEHPTSGWCTARLWWTPDVVEEPAASRWLDEPGVPDRPDLLHADPPTIAICERQFSLEQGRARLVDWGHFERLKHRALALAPDVKLVRVESWRLYFTREWERRGLAKAADADGA